MAWTGNFKRISRKRSWWWLLALLLFAQLVQADEPVLARVVTINGDVVTVTPLDAPAGTSPITVTVDAAELTAELAPGKVVRLWPSDRVDQNGLMRGARLTPLERGGGQVDRTGVRARLMRGAGRGPPGRPRGH